MCHIKPLSYLGYPRSPNWTLDFEPTFSQRVYFPLSPRSLFPTRQRFPFPNHVTSGCMSPRSLFSHWSAVSPLKNTWLPVPVMTSSVHQNEAHLDIRAYITTNRRRAITHSTPCEIVVRASWTINEHEIFFKHGQVGNRLGKANSVTCLPEGQAGIQVFVEPWPSGHFCGYILTEYIPQPMQISEKLVEQQCGGTKAI